jgi:hypothetical protein
MVLRENQGKVKDEAAKFSWLSHPTSINIWQCWWHFFHAWVKSIHPPAKDPAVSSDMGPNLNHMRPQFNTGACQHFFSCTQNYSWERIGWLSWEGPQRPSIEASNQIIWMFEIIYKIIHARFVFSWIGFQNQKGRHQIGILPWSIHTKMDELAKKIYSPVSPNVWILPKQWGFGC